MSLHIRYPSTKFRDTQNTSRKKQLLKPSRLRPGDAVAVISPAGSLDASRLQRLEHGLNYLRQQGYRVVEGSSLRRQTGYLAGNDGERADDLNSMLRDPEIKALFCARGGYGITRILSRIDYEAARLAPKIIVGFSDVTALQMALFQQIGLITFSGPMVAVELGDRLTPLTESSLWRQIREGKVDKYKTDNQFPALGRYFSGRAEGRLLGGCLSVLVSLLGTPFFPNLKNAILILEDVGEELYKIDRYFSQLVNAGVFETVKGVILGQFKAIHPDQNVNPIEFDEMVTDYLGPLNVPVIGGFPYGHISDKYTLPFGVRIRMDADNGKIVQLESGVV